MSVTMLPKRFGQSKPVAQIEIFIGANESPTGHRIRFRRRIECEDLEDAKALAIRIEGALRNTGQWTPETPRPLIGQPRTRDEMQPPSGRALKDALALAWGCPREGWALRQSGALEYKRARTCVALLRDTTPCARIAAGHFERLREHFTREGFKPGVIEQYLQALYRVLHFAEREGWMRDRPYLERRNVYAKPRAKRSAEELEARAIERRRTFLERMRDGVVDWYNDDDACS